MKKAGIVIGVVILVMIVGSCLSSGTDKSSSHKSIKSNSGSASQAAPTTHAPNGADWMTVNGDAWTAVADDLSTLGKDTSGDINLDVIRQDCQSIATDTATLQQASPYPDAGIQAQFQQFESNLIAAGTNCVGAIDSNDTNQLDTAMTQFGNASDQINKVVDSMP